MAFWLIKSEPGVFSIAALRKSPKKTTGWDGVRNFQARNFLKAMKKGDQAVFYYSNAEPSGAAGIVEVAREAYPDPTQFDKRSNHFEPRATAEAPVWFQVDVAFVEAFPSVLTLEELKRIPALKDMVLFKNARLSVQPVTEAQWRAILAAGRRGCC